MGSFIDVDPRDPGEDPSGVRASTRSARDGKNVVPGARTVAKEKQNPDGRMHRAEIGNVCLKFHTALEYFSRIQLIFRSEDKQALEKTNLKFFLYKSTIK